jgi:hypothetical protein
VGSALSACSPSTLLTQDFCTHLQASSAHQQAETRSINKSLSTFNSCLHTLWLNQQKNSTAAVVPVRSSALTRILSSAMHGRGHLALSVHFSLKEEDLEATRRTLDFAERAAQITVDVRAKVCRKCLHTSSRKNVSRKGDMSIVFVKLRAWESMNHGIMHCLLPVPPTNCDYLYRNLTK